MLNWKCDRKKLSVNLKNMKSNVFFRGLFRAMSPLENPLIVHVKGVYRLATKEVHCFAFHFVSALENA